MKLNLRNIIAASVAVAMLVCAAAPAAEIKTLKKSEVDKYIASLKGKVVIVDFWATWCPPCRQEIPGFIALQKKYGDKLVVVGLSLDDSVDPVKSFYKDKGMNYSVFVVGDDTVKAWGNFEGIPTTFIIDKNGKKVGEPHTGFAPPEVFENLIKPLL
jgi:thiol-disulfide isomerase/thioredoxin